MKVLLRFFISYEYNVANLNIATDRSQSNEILFVLFTETIKSHSSSIACIAEKYVI